MKTHRLPRAPLQTESVRELYQVLGMRKKITGERAILHINAPPVKSPVRRKNVSGLRPPQVSAELTQECWVAGLNCQIKKPTRHECSRPRIPLVWHKGKVTTIKRGTTPAARIVL